MAVRIEATEACTLSLAVIQPQHCSASGTYQDCSKALRLRLTQENCAEAVQPNKRHVDCRPGPGRAPMPCPRLQQWCSAQSCVACALLACCRGHRRPARSRPAFAKQALAALQPCPGRHWMQANCAHRWTCTAHRLS